MNGLSFIRDVFRRNKTTSSLSDTTKSLAKNAQMSNLGTSMGVLRNDDLFGMLSLDRGMLARLKDYDDMDSYPDISSALDIYADEATQEDSTSGKALWVESKDELVKESLTEMFEKRLEIDGSSWEIIRNLCKDGNDYEDIAAKSGVGVVGLSYLPTRTMRRVENDRSELLGFLQTYSGNVEVSEAQLKKFQFSGGKAINDAKDVAAFEDWRVVHMRLTAKHRESMYGWSVIDPARWVWKRLMLLEDAVIVYKMCLKGDSQVWTPNGRKAIRDLLEGDEVYSYTTDDRLKKTCVVYKKHNGKDVLYRVKSAHRELYANATHPILVETIIKKGKGSPRGRRLDYVEVQDLIPGVHRLVTPFKDDDLSEAVPLVMPKVGQKAWLSEKAIADGIKIEVGVKRLQDNCGMQSDLIKRFFAGDYEVVAHTAKKVLKENGTPEDYLCIRDDWGGAKNVSLPKVVTPEFAKWFGFMIGDGHASERPFTKNGKTYLVRDVGFSAGDNEEVNNEYKKLFESFFGETRFDKDKRSCHDCVGSYRISSKPLYEFMILNGFIPGAHEKRIPDWVFRSPVVIRQAFLEGLADADGNIQEGGVSEDRGRVRHKRFVIELCNEALVNDVRELAMQSGFKVTRVIPRVHSGGREILNNGFLLPERMSYTVAWSMDRQPMTEVLKSVEEVEVDDIWDIGVEADEHNFVANGIVVHNTRSPSRYAFYIDTGKVPKRESERILKEAMQRLKKHKFVDPKTGKLNLKASPLAMDQDFFFTTREGRETTRVDTLMGPSYQQVDDVEYFLHKLYAALKVPRAWMGYDENMPSRATLSMEDARFGRTIMRIQREFRKGMRHVAKVDLAARNIDPASVDFDIRMTVPSAIFELGQMEARRARADLASMMERHVSLHWLLKNIYRLSDDEIEEISKEKESDRKKGGDSFEDIQGQGGISDRELFSGSKEDEKRVEEAVKRQMEDPRSLFGKKLAETGNLLREILHTIKKAA